MNNILEKDHSGEIISPKDQGYDKLINTIIVAGNPTRFIKNIETK